ncbi:hypothetical protein LR48_Vigan04g069200 [Vigna angularis]|uniref:Uncharacterized protein n=1 Tax=Phaseolus angularis TaxID=3914 RepID=A0A0L9UDA2_PHAAN|nr:hypothetical protein LR48_Vigan04g069200 [Vigna angularis]
MGDRGTKKQKASSSVGGRRRRRSPTLSPSSSPPTPTNDLFSSDEQEEKYAQHFVNREILEMPTESDPISELKLKQKIGCEVVASFGYVQNDEGEWVPKGNAPHPPLQEVQHEKGQDDEQGSSSTTLNNVINRIEQLQTFVGTRFDAFETRFDALETRFQNMDVVINTRFDALQSRVGNIEQLQHFQSASDNNPQT